MLDYCNDIKDEVLLDEEVLYEPTYLVLLYDDNTTNVFDAMFLIEQAFNLKREESVKIVFEAEQNGTAIVKKSLCLADASLYIEKTDTLNKKYNLQMKFEIKEEN